MASCRIRDETMLELGVRLEDRGDDSVWKLDDPKVLRQEQEAKRQALAEQQLKKAVAAHNKKQAVCLVPWLLLLLSCLSLLAVMFQCTACQAVSGCIESALCRHPRCLFAA